MRRNPYVTALSALGAMALILAVLMTVAFSMANGDDVKMDAGFATWTYILIGIGIASLVGVVVIAGVAWTLRRAGFDV